MLTKTLAALLAAGVLYGAELIPAALELRENLRLTERSIDRRFGESRMKVIGRTQAGYLEGFGAVFTLEVNVIPTANLSPFRPEYSEEELRQLNQRKRDSLKELEELAVDILVDEAVRLKNLPKKEVAALIISLFHFTWEDTTGLPSQLVIQARLGHLLRRESGRLTDQELTKRIEIRYY